MQVDEHSGTWLKIFYHEQCLCIVTFVFISTPIFNVEIRLFPIEAKFDR
jgi:hypothetical protein